MSPKLGPSSSIVKRNTRARLDFPRPRDYTRIKEIDMDITPLGPSNLDPFTPTPRVEEVAETSDNAAEEAREPAPLPEGSGTMVDTSV